MFAGSLKMDEIRTVLISNVSRIGTGRVSKLAVYVCVLEFSMHVHVLYVHELLEASFMYIYVYDD